MTRLKRRIVSGMLVLSMLATFLPISASATNEKNNVLSDWLLCDAFYDDDKQCFVLTEDYKGYVTGSIWYNTPCTNNFSLELDYYTGSSNRSLGGADGIAIAFYADYDYKPGKGEELGFDGSKGYGIELDTFSNARRGDPSYNHIALIKESVGNHLVKEKLPESEDEQWHHLKIVVEDGLCSAYVDDILKISHPVEESGYGWIGITSSTGSGENLHAVRNIVVTADNDDNEENSAKYLDLQLSHQKLSDADGYYSYEITATIKNTAEATAKNTILLFASESSLTLEEESQEVISIGDFPSGAEKTVSWKATAPWPEESGPAVYSVIADIDNQTATLLKENYVYLLSKNENDNSFDFGIDQWNFSNSPTYFTDYKIVNGEAVWDEDYYLTDTDYSILQSNLSSNIEKELVDSLKNCHWGGSCYGMSVTAVLAKMDVINTHFLQALGAENLYEVSKYNDDKVESFINFYHLQQKTTAASNDRAEFSFKPTTEQLQIIEDKAEAVLTGGSPFILCFSGKEGAHAVVAYGMEHKDGGVLNPSDWKAGYDSRILIYDCNHPAGPIYLYYNTGTDEWYLPKYNKNDTPDTPIHATKLIWALDDLEIIDSVNYDIETQNHYARLLFESQADEYFLKQDDKTIKIDGNTDLREEGIITLYDANITADGVASPSTLNLLLPSLTESYVVEPISGESYKFDMIYENDMLTVSVDDAESISFSPDGGISATETTGEFQLSICSNEDSYGLPWFLVSVKGEDSDEISLKKSENGIIVRGSNLKNIMVTSEDTYGNVQNTYFSAVGTEAIIQADQEAKIVVKEDSNNDGEYDTVISGPKNDGKISVTDVSLNLSSVSLTHVGEICKLEAMVTPTDATNQIVTWTSSNPRVATVTNTGLVTAVSDGAATITATTQDGGYTATCEVTVALSEMPAVPVTGVKLNAQKIELNRAGDVYQIEADVTPLNATNQAITWISSNPGVATVTDAGLVTAVSNGVTTITATTQDGGYTATCEVRVELPEDPNVLVAGVELNTQRITLNRIGSSYQLKADVTPANATNQAVTWASSNPSVATVTDAGLVTAVSEGTAIITVTTEDGKKVATCTVTVWIDSGSGGTGGGGNSSSTAPTSYTITAGDAVGGTITISPKAASKEQTVTITAVPDEGFTLETLSVSDKNGNRIELTKKSETSYTFEMPASKVTVSATFTEIVVEPEPVVLPFDDILQSAWYYDAVEYVYSNDVMQGTSTTTFSPEVEMSRSMIATVLYRLADTPALTGSTSFSDVGGTEWYTDAIQWAAQKSIMNGYGNNQFGPLDSVTREQLAVILYNYTVSEGSSVEVTGDLSVFRDAEDTSDWAEKAISWAVGVGLLSGKGNGILDPTGTATRAEVAQMLMNYCTKVVLVSKT